MYPRTLPQRQQRLTTRVEYLGFLFALAIQDFFAIRLRPRYRSYFAHGLRSAFGGTSTSLCGSRMSRVSVANRGAFLILIPERKS